MCEHCIYQNSSHSTPRVFGVYYPSFGLMSSQVKISLNGVELNQWLPSLWEDAGGGLAMSLIKKLPLWKLLYIGHHKGNAQGAAPRSCCDEQWRKKSRSWGRPGEASSLWQGIGRCGGSMLLPYMSLKCKGHEWVSEMIGETNHLQVTR